MKGSIKDRFKKYNLHPTMLFIYLSLFIIIISGILSFLKVQNSYELLNTVTSTLDSYVVEVESLFSLSGLQYILSSAVSNFISFTPISMFLIMLLGVGICDRVGVFRIFFEKLCKKIPKYFITFIFCMLCVILSFDTDLGYVLLIPVGAILFIVMKRSALAGIACAFSMVSLGSGINLFLTSTDYNLNIYTSAFASMLDADYLTKINGNIYISIVAVLIIAIIGTFITEKFIVPKMDKYKSEVEEIDLITERQRKKGTKYAKIIAIIYAILIIYSIIPGLPLSGTLLDSSQTLYVNQLFGNTSLFAQGIVFIVSVFFILIGLFYGIGSEQIKNSRDFIRKMSESFNDLGGIIIMLFFASQFLAIFKKSKIGTIVITWLANLIGTLNFSSIILVLLVFIVVIIASFFVTSSVAKWSILSPVVVPLFLKSNLSPEFAQIVFRFAGAAAVQLTPVLIYFVLYLAYIEKYSKGIREFSIRKSYGLLLPYTLAIAGCYIIIIILWYIIGLPIGPGVLPTV